MGDIHGRFRHVDVTWPGSGAVFMILALLSCNEQAIMQYIDKQTVYIAHYYFWLMKNEIKF